MKRGANEFMNNHGIRFGKLETSGRHISHKDFKIKAASIIHHKYIFYSAC